MIHQRVFDHKYRPHGRGAGLPRPNLTGAVANMTSLELKTMLMDQHKVFYRDYLDQKVDELVIPLIGVDFSEEDMTPPPEPETPEEP